MKYSRGFRLKHLLSLLCLLVCSGMAYAQTTGLGTSSNIPTNYDNTPRKDTNANKSNTNKWQTLETRISYKKLNSNVVYTPDSALNYFQRRPFSQPWYRDQGNLGSPVENLMFTPENRLGPTLGYHVFDVYRFDPDSASFYNTTKPYSAFVYQLGSKLEQMAEIHHTRNITPRWNFSFDYRKINAQGFYKIQRNNHDNVILSTNYKSKSLRYELFGVLTYNKEQHDENGGLTTPAELLDPNYSDRKTLDVAFQNDNYSVLRSAVTNMQRDFTFLLQHSYTWGAGDTLYNADSTQYTYKIKPAFRITHKFELSTEKHEYKDLIPDSARYSPMFQHPFTNGGYYEAGISDTVLSQQKWFWIDNRFTLDGFLGKEGKQTEFSAGVGNRIDAFTTAYATGSEQDHILSNYIIGELKKEALQPGQWFYQANAQFFLTGDDAGDFLVHASLGKSLKGNWGNFAAGFQQQLNSAPYNYTLYENQYYRLATSFDKESVTQLYATLQSGKLRLSGGVRNYVIDNYIYIDAQLKPDQYKDPFNVSQLWIRKSFKAGILVLDNELTYQEVTGNGPVNVPALLGRHQLFIESSIFHNALKLATGVEVRYNTSYAPSGYDPFLNRFYYQNSINITNTPEASVFFNFRVKRFRAYVMADQVQQAFANNNTYFPGYTSQDIMVRFGFTWILIN